MVLVTLRAMARGGMHDQLGGGFHRYSVDENWFVPHFEKMLYDQAQLAISYLEAYQITGDAQYADVARDIFDYVLRDLAHPDGGFYSAEDADSAADPGGAEGKIGGRVLHLELSGNRGCSWGAGRGRVLQAVRRRTEGQRAGRSARRICRPQHPLSGSGHRGRIAQAVGCQAAGNPFAASASAPRRQDSHWLERDDDLSLRQRRADSRNRAMLRATPKPRGTRGISCAGTCGGRPIPPCCGGIATETPPSRRSWTITRV